MPPSMRRIALVTGASGGIGRATAVRLATAGYHVVVTARREGELDATVALIAGSGGRAQSVVCDLADPAEIEALMGRIEREHGRLDALVNNAGLVAFGPVADLSPGDWDRSLAVNLTAVFHFCRLAIPLMTGHAGAIVNIASISGVPNTSKLPGSAAYAAAKAGVIGFTEVLATELAPLGLRVNAVSPGSVDTEMLRRAAPDLTPDMAPEEVAETIAFLLSPASRPMNGRNLELYGV